jgi:hypothetical protein
MDPTDLKLIIELGKLVAGLAGTLVELVNQIESGEAITPEQREKATNLRKNAMEAFTKAVEGTDDSDPQ